MIEFIETNRILIALIIMIIIATIELIFKRNKINKLEKTVENLKKEKETNNIYINSLQKANSNYNYNTAVLVNFITFYNILTDILTSKLGAKAEGFTYRTFDYKKENGVTIEKKVNTRKVKVKGEVGYIIKDKYFIKKADLDALLLKIQAHLKSINVKDSSEKEIAYAMLNKLVLAFKLNPSLFNIEVEEVRGDYTFVIND
jgi:hypothetical protein